MATQAQGKAVPAAKSEAYVEEQLTRARRRVRLLDVTAASFGFAILLLIFGLAAALTDRWTGGLAPSTRQLALAGFALTAIIYLGVFLVRPLLRSVNPYYAALKVEQTLPGAKNSVVNWLDLHAQPLPSAFKTAVAGRAAKDLGRADLERAFSIRSALILGGVTLVLFLFFALQIALGGREFLARLARVFVPFGFSTTAPITQTHIKVVEPVGGDVTVPVRRAVQIAVEVTGKVPKSNRPDALRLRYHYHQNEPYEERPFEHDGTGNRWVVQVPAFQVHNEGFFYHVAGGDAREPVSGEYRVQVRPTPLVSDITVTYKYRPYLAMPERTTREPNLEAFRGTTVILIAKTNRTVGDGTLEYVNEKGDSTNIIKGVPVGPADPQSLRFEFIIDTTGTYRIWFRSVEDERNTDAVWYKIRSIADTAPRVVLTKPATDLKMPLNAVLTVEGRADDDFGVTGMTLRMQINSENPILTKPFRDRKDFKLTDGSYPQNLDYKDFVSLDQLRDPDGKPLKPGVVEYWLEATDACDYPPPGPNVGKSEVRRIFLTKPDAKNPNAKKQAAKDKADARKEQEKFEEKQDKDQKELSKQKEEDRKRKEEEKDAAKNAEKEGSTKEKPKTPEEQQAEKEAQARRDKLLDDLKNKQADEDHQKNQGEAKGEGKQNPGEPKGEGKQPGDKKNEGEQKPNPQHADDGGKARDGGKENPDKQPNGTGKGPGKNEDGKPDAGNQGNDQKEPGQGRDDGKKGPNQKENEGKGRGEGKTGRDQKKNEGQARDGGKEDKGGKGNKGESRDGGKPEAGAGQNESADNKGAAKPGPKPPTDGKGQARSGPAKPEPSSEGKGAGNQASKPGTEKPDGKGKGPGKNGPAGAGEEKPAGPGKPDEIAKGKGDGKHPGSGDPKDGEASKEVRDLVDSLKNGSPKEQKNAKDKLEQIRRDPKQGKGDRDAASRALDEKEGKGDGSERAGNDGKGRELSDEAQQKVDRASRDIKDLVEKLQKGDAKERKQAQDDLEKKGRDAPAKIDRDAANAAARELGDQKPEPGKDDKGPNGQNNNNQNGNDGKPGDDDGSKDGSAKSKAGKNSGKAPGENPGIGTVRPGATREGAPNDVIRPGETKVQANRNRERPGDLLLRKFADSVTPEMLKKAGITPEEWQKFLANRGQTPPSARTPERLPGRTPGTTISREGVREYKPSTDRTAPLQIGGRSLPPPELMEGFKRFSEEPKK